MSKSKPICFNDSKPVPRLYLDNSRVIKGVELGERVTLVVEAELVDAEIKDYEGKPSKRQGFIIRSIKKKGETDKDKNNKIANFMHGGRGGMK